MKTFIDIAVRAAEQSGAGGVALTSSKSKRDYAVKYVQDALIRTGLPHLAIHVGEIETMIEAALFEGVLKPTIK